MFKFSHFFTYCIVFIFFTFLSCNNQSNREIEINKSKIIVDLTRFDVEFSKTTPHTLSDIKQKYPFMFPKKYKDSFWLAKLNDSLQQLLFKESHKQFSDFSDQKKAIKLVFKHLKYYYPEFKIPRIVTTTSYVDYRNKIIVTDTLLFIALDTYLGAKHFFYEDIPLYLRSSFTKSQMVVDIALEYAKKKVFKHNISTFLDELILQGKYLYFAETMLPDVSEANLMNYSVSQLNWVISNESYIWRYFVDRELLFNTNTKLVNRFINPAPFSKFYLEEIDRNSPGRVGQYIGWQIVKSYMANNTVTLKQMLNKTSEEIFNNSKFKPRKL